MESLELSNIGIVDCFCNSLSSETMPAFSLSDKARKSISFGCSGNNSNALGILLEYLENGTNIIIVFNFSMNSSKSFEDSLVFLNISDLCFSNSVNANSGEYNLCLNNSFFINDPFQKNENNLLVSKTNFIYIIPLDLSSFKRFSLASSPSFSASLFENSLLFSLDSINSINSSFLINSCLTNLDQVTQTNLDKSDFNSSSTAKVIDAIYIISSDFSNFFNSCIFSDMILRANAPIFTSGNFSLNSLNNSSGIDNVTLGIFSDSGIYLYQSKYVELFKSFDFKEEVIFLRKLLK